VLKVPADRRRVGLAGKRISRTTGSRSPARRRPPTRGVSRRRAVRRETGALDREGLGQLPLLGSPVATAQAREGRPDHKDDDRLDGETPRRGSPRRPSPAKTRLDDPAAPAPKPISRRTAWGLRASSLIQGGFRAEEPTQSPGPTKGLPGSALSARSERAPPWRAERLLAVEPSRERSRWRAKKPARPTGRSEDCGGEHSTSSSTAKLRKALRRRLSRTGARGSVQPGLSRASRIRPAGGGSAMSWIDVPDDPLCRRRRSPLGEAPRQVRRSRRPPVRPEV
jgi:hypothetical protein